MDFRSYSPSELRELVVVLLRMKFFPQMGPENYSKVLNRLLTNIHDFVKDELEDTPQKQMILGPYNSLVDDNFIQMVLDGLKAQFPYKTETFEQLHEDFRDGIYPRAVSESQWVMVGKQIGEIAKNNEASALLISTDEFVPLLVPTAPLRFNCVVSHSLHSGPLAPTAQTKSRRFRFFSSAFRGGVC